MKSFASFRKKAPFRAASFLLAGAGLCMGWAAQATTVTYTSPFTSTVTTRFPTPLPSGSVGTTFTQYTTTAVPYITGTFYVGQSGSYSGALSGITVANGILFLTGQFSPASTSTPTTPLANFLAGTQSGSGATIPGVNLIAGQEYSFLLLFQSGSNGIATFTLDGLGCISLGSNACADYVTQGNVLSNDPSVPAGNVLSALNAAGTSTGDMATVLNTFNAYSESQLNTEVRKLAPVNNNAPTLGALAASTSGLNTVSGRTAILRGDTQASAGETGLAAGDDPRKRAFWVKAFGSRSRQDKQDNFDGYQADAYGASFGADTEVANNLRVGGAFTYADTDIGQRDFRQGDGTNIDSYQLTAYGMKEYGAAYVDVMGAYSRHNYQSHRATALGRTANGEWNGDQFSLRLDGGYRLPLGNALLIPMASLEWSQLKQGSYTETGAGALNQANDSSRFNTLNAGLGARLSTQFDAGSSTITPDVHAMAYHNFGDRGLDSTSRFTGGGSSFTTPGLKIARDTYNLGVGVSVQPNKLAKVSLNYDFEGRSGFQGHAVQLTGRWDF